LIWLTQPKSQYEDAHLRNRPCTYILPAASASIKRGGLSPPSFYTIIFTLHTPTVGIHGSTDPKSSLVQIRPPVCTRGRIGTCPEPFYTCQRSFLTINAETGVLQFKESGTKNTCDGMQNHDSSIDTPLSTPIFLVLQHLESYLKLTYYSSYSSKVYTYFKPRRYATRFVAIRQW
jgi:hypothetical protein